MRCKLHNNIPHCNLCYDSSIAAAQIAEGKRNRAFSQQGLPLVVPDHYATVRLALEKGTQFACFTGVQKYLLYKYRSTSLRDSAPRARGGAQFTCFTSTKVEIAPFRLALEKGTQFTCFTGTKVQTMLY